MTGLLSLPSELLQAIGNDLGSEKKQLRLVCTELSVAMEPLVLSHVVINVARSRLSTVNAQLQSLASRKQRTAHFIRKLTICSLSPIRDSQPPCAQVMFAAGAWTAVRKDGDSSDPHGEAVMKEYLEKAISNMENLQVLKWSTKSDDPAWTSLAVIKGLARSRTILYVNLYLGLGFDISLLRLDLLRGLKRIVISGLCEVFPPSIVKRLQDCITQSPEMNSIDIDNSLCRADSTIPSLHCLLGDAPPMHLEHLGLHSWYTRFDNITLPHLRYLKSLALHNTRGFSQEGHTLPSTTMDIWPALRTSKIYLERLSTDAIDSSLIEYLSSYSGLTRLYLKNIAISDYQSSDQLAQLFFDSVLSSHSSTLEDLYILPRYEGKWCFGPYTSPSIIRCSRLQYLKVAVISSQVNPSSDGDIIRFLINAAARHLRALKKLSITTAQAESLRGSGHAEASKRHFSLTNMAIANAITACLPDPIYQAYLPQITANFIKYTPELRQVLEAEETRSCLRYRRLN